MGFIEQEFCSPGKRGMGDDGMECSGICPTKCGPGELQCWGGRDSNGCEREGTCMPIHQGNTDNNGNECPASCPVNCADDEYQCSGGSYPNGCRAPDICMQGNILLVQMVACVQKTV